METLKNIPKRLLQMVIDLLSNGAIVYLEGAPGAGKSEIIKKIARWMGGRFIFLNCVGEDEVTLIGRLREEEYLGHKVTARQYVKWAVEANHYAQEGQHVFVLLDEFNRAPDPVRNGFLTIMSSRKLGYDFKLHDKVHICAAGNLGEEDGCNVEAMDQANRQRLVVYKYSSTVGEWVDEFAREKVHGEIVRFLQGYPEFLHFTDKASNVTLSPRRWEYFSKAIASAEKVAGWNFKTALNNLGDRHIGEALVARFNQFLNEAVGLKQLIAKPELLNTIPAHMIDGLGEELKDFVCKLEDGDAIPPVLVDLFKKLSPEQVVALMAEVRDRRESIGIAIANLFLTREELMERMLQLLEGSNA